MLKYIALALVLTLIYSSIAYIFWAEEVQYALPTPKPKSYVQVPMGQAVSRPVELKTEKPVFLHFYNFDCPCSRFNIDEFRQLVNTYRDQIYFVAVVQDAKGTSDLSNKFQEKFNLSIQVITDPEGAMAETMGVYSTPQAVLIDKESTIFYRGNYNLSRYCLSKNTQFAEMAIQDLLAGKTTPSFLTMVPEPYGCSLPSNQTELTLATSLP